MYGTVNESQTFVAGDRCALSAVTTSGFH